MTSYKYSGDPRYYPSLGLSVADGDTLDFEGEAPADGRWSVVADAAPAGVPAPAPAPPSPASVPDPSTDATKE